MRCRNVKKILNRYADKELNDADAVILIEEHLKSCPYCRAELDALISIKRLISLKERLKEDPCFLFRLEDKLKPQTTEIKLQWVLDTGNFARRLILVPALLTILIMVMVFNSSASLKSTPGGAVEIDIVSEEIDPFVLFSYTLFKN